MKKINQKDYKFYLVNKKTNKIDTGWEYKKDANDAKINRDNDDFAVYTKIHLNQIGLNPDENKSWLKESLNEDVNITDPQIAQEYTAIEKQIIDKQNQINQINRDILTLEKNKQALEQKATLAQKVATNTTQQTTQNKPAQNTQTIQQTTQKTEGIHSISSLDNFLIEALEDPSNIDAMDVLNVDARDYIKDENREEEIKDAQEDLKENDEYVFYVKIDDGGEEFIGKIYKNEPESDWLGSIKVGENPAFEKMAYEPTYDENDILEFLKDNFDNAEIIDQDEYDNYFKKENKNYEDILDIDYTQ